MAVEFATFSDLKRFTNDLTLNEQSAVRSTASAKSSKDTFLSHSSKDTEYLGLYRHIVHGFMKGESNRLWMVYDYRKNTAIKLREWLK